VTHYAISSDVVIRLLAATLFGALVGAEREISDQPAGLRTHIGVCMGAALFGVVSTLGFDEYVRVRADTNVQVDVTRVASQVVVGLGFLGAGLIVRQEGKVLNLTTAASVWAVAAIGLTCGVGDVGTAALAVVITLGYLIVLRPVRTWLERHIAKARCSLRVVFEDGSGVGSVLDSPGDDISFRVVAIEKDAGRPALSLRVVARSHEGLQTWLSSIANRADVIDLRMD
jgi:putative Mg2+ transporter-C (MgtC) family protein